MGILYGAVARSPDAGHGGKKTYPIVDGGGHIAQRSQMSAPLGDRFVVLRPEIEGTPVNQHDQGMFS